MAYDTPTQMAKEDCLAAASFFYPLYAGSKRDEMANLAMGLSQISNAIRHLAEGLHQTYQKLEEIDKKLSVPR